MTTGNVHATLQRATHMQHAIVQHATCNRYLLPLQHATCNRYLLPLEEDFAVLERHFRTEFLRAAFEILDENPDILQAPPACTVCGIPSSRAMVAFGVIRRFGRCR